MTSALAGAFKRGPAREEVESGANYEMSETKSTIPTFRTPASSNYFSVLVRCYKLFAKPEAERGRTQVIHSLQSRSRVYDWGKALGYNVSCDGSMQGVICLAGDIL